MSAPRFELAEAARRDIAGIRAYTRANWGKAKEAAYVADLFSRLERLAERPMMGRARPELAEDVRSLTSDRHLILYRPKTAGGVSILRVIHQSQNIPGEFDG